MPAETSSLQVLTANQTAVHHGGATDAGAERDHDNIARAAGCASVPFAEQRHARVVFDEEIQSEFLSTPAWQIQVRGVVVLFVRRNHPSGVDVGQPTETQRDTGDIR